MTEEQTAELARAIRDAGEAIARAILGYYRELQAPAVSPGDGWNCEGCGSPNWEPGGQASAFRKCRECGSIGEAIDNAE